jgi:hypothetical protein
VSCLTKIEGIDLIFYLRFAEMEPTFKNSMSHRYKALEKLVEYLHGQSTNMSEEAGAQDHVSTGNKDQ